MITNQKLLKVLEDPEAHVGKLIHMDGGFFKGLDGSGIVMSLDNVTTNAKNETVCTFRIEYMGIYCGHYYAIKTEDGWDDGLPEVGEGV